jgi:ABC-type proline/glycine betaine transport system permease subunit
MLKEIEALLSVAEKSFTGMETIPNEIVAAAVGLMGMSSLTKKFLKELMPGPRSPG